MSTGIEEIQDFWSLQYVAEVILGVRHDAFPLLRFHPILSSQPAPLRFITIHCGKEGLYVLSTEIRLYLSLRYNLDFAR